MLKFFEIPNYSKFTKIRCILIPSSQEFLINVSDDDKRLCQTPYSAQKSRKYSGSSVITSIEPRLFEHSSATANFKRSSQNEREREHARGIHKNAL